MGPTKSPRRTPVRYTCDVIASDRKAVKVGSALLVVDGTDETLARKAELSSIRLNRVQARSLQAL